MKRRSTYQFIFALLLLRLGTAPAWAEGTLTHLSGLVSVQKSDGQVLRGAAGAKVSVGDTVITGAGGYVRMEMTDGGEMVLRPNSELKVDSYRFVEATSAEDNFVFSMLKGGLRTVTGLIGKRSNRDAYRLNTQTATIGIRGTQFDLRVCQANCGALADGTYVAVRFGAIQTTNAQGSLAVAAGQVGYAPPQRPPVMLPRNPGIGFTPPAVIPRLDERKKVTPAPAASTPGQTRPGASGSGQSGQTPQRGGQSGTGSSRSGQSETSGKTEGSGSASNSGNKDGSGSDTGGKSSSQGSSGGASGASSGRDGGSAATQQSVSTVQGVASASVTASPAQGVASVDAAASIAPLSSPTTQSTSGPDCSVQ